MQCENPNVSCLSNPEPHNMSNTDQPDSFGTAEVTDSASGEVSSEKNISLKYSQDI